MKEVLERLLIFKDALILDEDDVKTLTEWLNIIVGKGLTHEDKLITMFTHASMMIHRSKVNQFITKLDDAIIDEIYNDNNINEAEELFSYLSNIYNLHSNEKDYMMLHLCSLLGE